MLLPELPLYQRKELKCKPYYYEPPKQNYNLFDLLYSHLFGLLPSLILKAAVQIRNLVAIRHLDEHDMYLKWSCLYRFPYSLKHFRHLA